jgi:TolB-like protein/class 3 adenylate cyclase/Tfp pilus assembly protein PilF
VNTKPDDRERRLETIMVADIVGYSRLMDADEEGTYTALRSVRTEVLDPKIEEYGANVVKHLGDGFLAEFPTVMAAVRFAMSFQEEMGRRAEGLPKDRQIKLRIGINLGDVIVDEDGDIFGDGVNVAARLEALAIPGGICISAPVYTSVHKKLDVGFDNLGDQSVKNISTPVHAYDVRWPGEAGTPDERKVKPTAKPKPTRLIAGAAVIVAVLIGLVFWQLNPFEPAYVAAPEKSIAVLPFVNMSDDAGNEYFSDGISEELLNLLARIPELRVAARTSSFFYKDKLDTITLAEVAQQLDVAHVLEGSVRKSGNQVRITAQLIRASDSTHLWSATYDRTMEDIFVIQDEIASKVVAQLKFTLLGAPPTVETADLAAYALFLQARQVGAQATPNSLEQSIVLIKQALEIDPEYAIAWATLADFYMLRRFMGGWDHGEIRTLAREAANHALSLDPTNATALTALGLIALAYDRDLATAARHYSHALEFDPTNTLILMEALRLSRVLGQTEAAIAIGEYLATVDPLNTLAHVESGWAYFYEGRWDEAITTFRTAIKLSPRAIQAHVGIGLSLLRKGEPEAALLSIQQELFEAYKQAGLVMAYYALGNETESDAVLTQFIENYGHNRAAVTALMLSFRGEADRAFEQLDKAVQNIDAELIQLVAGGFFFEVLNDPRWLPFLERIGMSPDQLAAIEFNVTLPE